MLAAPTRSGFPATDPGHGPVDEPIADRTDEVTADPPTPTDDPTTDPADPAAIPDGDALTSD